LQVGPWPCGDEDHLGARWDEPRVISELADGHSDGLASNRTLRFNQQAGGLVVEVRVERLALSGREDLETGSGVARPAEVVTEGEHKAALSALGLVGIPGGFDVGAFGELLFDGDLRYDS